MTPASPTSTRRSKNRDIASSEGCDGRMRALALVGGRVRAAFRGTCGPSFILFLARLEIEYYCGNCPPRWEREDGRPPNIFCAAMRLLRKDSARKGESVQSSDTMSNRESRLTKR